LEGLAKELGEDGLAFWEALAAQDQEQQ